MVAHRGGGEELVRSILGSEAADGGEGGEEED